MFADLLTRWSKGYRSIIALTRQIAALYNDMTPSTDITPVTMEEAKSELRKYNPPKTVV